LTICREWLLHRQAGPNREAKLLRCRSWNCTMCAPDRKRQLMAQCAGGDPNRFLTLTINPRTGNSPEHRLQLLAWAWRTAVKRIRREKGHDSLEYFAIVEETKAGEPHLHILLRSPFISQSYLSNVMTELIDSPIVDIRSIKGTRQIVNYVAKYVSKKPAQFGTSKRYWKSSKYDLEEPFEPQPRPEGFSSWQVWREGTHALLLQWLYDGYAYRSDGQDRFLAIPITPNEEQPRWKPPPSPASTSSATQRPMSFTSSTYEPFASSRH